MSIKKIPRHTDIVNTVYIHNIVDGWVYEYLYVNTLRFTLYVIPEPVARGYKTHNEFHKYRIK